MRGCHKKSEGSEEGGGGEGGGGGDGGMNAPSCDFDLCQTCVETCIDAAAAADDDGEGKAGGGDVGGGGVGGMGAEEGAEGGLEEGAGEGLVSTLEAAMYVVCSQTYHTWSLYHSGVDAIESMMRSQLAAAVGKVLKASDFSEYMAYHQRLLFRDEYDE